MIVEVYLHVGTIFGILVLILIFRDNGIAKIVFHVFHSDHRLFIIYIQADIELDLSLLKHILSNYLLFVTLLENLIFIF